MSRLLLRAAAPAVLWIPGCVSAPDQRAPVYREAQVLMEQGVAAHADSRYLAAAVAFGKALDRYQGIDDGERVLESRISLAEAALALGRTDAARLEFDAARALLPRTADAAARAPRLDLLEAALAASRGELPAARGLLARAARVRVRCLDRAGSLATLERLEALDRALGEPERARAVIADEAPERWPEFADQVPAFERADRAPAPGEFPASTCCARRPPSSIMTVTASSKNTVASSASW